MTGWGRVTRRELLATIGAGWLADQALPDRTTPYGRIVGASHRVGHLLRDGFATASGGPSARADVVIVGSGASAASAAFRLRASGLELVMLELEPFAGGTSAWSDDGAVPHPWGAHYLPAPEADARATVRLLAELGVVTGFDAAGRPQFREELLCHAPEERLFYQGAWHPSLVPDAALSLEERAELARFETVRADMRRARGRDGRFAFASPAEHSSRDPEWLALDRITMAAWLAREGFRTPMLRWTVEYATRDDYGAALDQVSAWAGWHYFAARKLDSAELEGSRLLVWPEGNGWLVRRMLDGVERRHEALCVSLAPARSGVAVDYLDVPRRERRRIEARAVIAAVPAFVLRRLIARGEQLPVRVASPWLVANLHVRRPPDPDAAWDSVLYDSPGLGYVDAGHQRTRPHERTVLTYFRAFGGPEVAATRGTLQAQSWTELASEVLLDLGRAHPTLGAETERIDVMIWGHAMPRPLPGFLGAQPFAPTDALDERIAWAHVDQTGFALFEEANQHGTRAAERVARWLGADAGESWL